MSIFGNIFNKIFYSNEENEVINESLKQFKDRGKSQKTYGEGIEDVNAITGFGTTGVGSFNLFYETQINKELRNSKAKIYEYRKMYEMPEIGDVVENAAMESTQENIDGEVVTLEFVDEALEKNENIRKNIQDEFDKLFYERIKIKKVINDWFITLFVDGKLFLENVINDKKSSIGILNAKKLPAETMDYDIDYKSGRVSAFYQMLSDNAKKPGSLEEADIKDNVIGFFPAQITFIDSGIYGLNKKDVLGYLHKCRQPFNQLRLLETSVVIYRLIRSPERLVFKIDTGNMPKDKSMKYVEKIKNKFTKKQIYDPNTGSLANSTDVTSMLENYFLAQSSDGRGSSIESVGGNPSGFTELDDIHYFQKKLYRSLKYPMSRVESMQDKRNGEIVFGNNNNEIERDEIRWAKFLESYQKRVCEKLLDMFMLHLTFIGFVKQYELDVTKLRITMNSPNDYIDRINQSILVRKFENYQAMANNPEFPKTYLMRKYLDYDEEDFKSILIGWNEDKKYLPKEEDNSGF